MPRRLIEILITWSRRNLNVYQLQIKQYKDDLLTIPKQECIEERKSVETKLPGTPGLICSEKKDNDVEQYGWCYSKHII